MSTISTKLAQIGSGTIVEINPTRAALLNTKIGMGIAMNGRIYKDRVGAFIVNNLMYRFQSNGYLPYDGLYVYLYLDETSVDGLNADKNLPSFINNDLSMDNSKVTCVFNGQTEADTNKLKNGILATRDAGMLNCVDDLSFFVDGMSFFAAAGYGTGRFNCICIAPFDLSTLQSKFGKDGRFLYGKAMVETGNQYFGYIGDGKTAMVSYGCAENEILVKGFEAVYRKNMSTGKVVEVNDITVASDVWGNLRSKTYLINGKLYYVAMTGYSNYMAVCCYDPFANTFVKSSNQYRTEPELVMVGEKLYFHSTNTEQDILKEIDLNTLKFTGSNITLSKAVYSIRNIGSGYGYCTDAKSPTFKFTDINNIDGTLTGVLFISSAFEMIDGNGKSHFITSYEVNEPGETFCGTNGYYNFMVEVDPNIGPILGYYKDSIISEKRAADEINVNIFDIVSNG